MADSGSPAVLSLIPPALGWIRSHAPLARAAAGQTQVLPLQPAPASLHLVRETTPRIRPFEPQSLELVRGRRAILRIEEQLRELARTCGQAGEADHLAYFLTLPDALKKTPWLIAERQPNGALSSAVLVFEYRFGSFGSGVYATADATGRRGVLAVPARREHVAAAAARRLIARGAAMVHIAFSRTHRDPQSSLSTLTPDAAPGLNVRTVLPAGTAVRGLARGRWALSEQEMRLYLPLAASFDETLKRIGQRTRSNLRYYRRRAEAELGAVFVPRVEIGREDFVALDRLCRYAVGDARARWRFDSLAGLRAPLLAGVRATRGECAGQWLSLVGGREHNTSAEIDWQMNRAELPASSLSTVLRSYLIEHMIGEGMKRLYIEGGTPQPISLSFATEEVAELTVVSGSAYARLLDLMGPALAPQRNYLAQVLRRPALNWHDL